MKFKLKNGKLITVDFKRVEDKEFESIRKDGAKKTMYIAKLSTEGNEETHLTSQARCYHGDPFEKSQGRKIAFQRVISDFPRSERKELHAQYIACCPIKKKENKNKVK